MSGQRYIPDTALGGDGKEKWCDRCGEKIKPARVTAGYVGSGRRVYGAWYGVMGYPGGIFCPGCALWLVAHPDEEITQDERNKGDE